MTSSTLSCSPSLRDRKPLRLPGRRNYSSAEAVESVFYGLSLPSEIHSITDVPNTYGCETLKIFSCELPTGEALAVLELPPGVSVNINSTESAPEKVTGPFEGIAFDPQGNPQKFSLLREPQGTGSLYGESGYVSIATFKEITGQR